jgi:hypothetical protein
MSMQRFDSPGQGTVMTFVNPNFYSPAAQTAVQASAGSGDLVLDGKLTTKDLDVTGTATIHALFVSGKASLADLAVTGKAQLHDLAVTGQADLATLNVTGDTTLTNVTVAKHFTTAGVTPTVAAGAESGKDAKVTIDGNDISGTITVTTGTDAAKAGNLAVVTFATAYGQAPHVVISARGTAAAQIQPYLGDVSATTFNLAFLGTLEPKKTYQFEYFVTQSQAAPSP